MGGSTLDAEGVLTQFAEAIGLVPPENDTVIVHGGGKDIGRQLERMGRKFTFVDGLRVTDDDVIDVVEMVLSGLVNKWISRALGKKNIRAAGISGTDLGLFHATKLVVKGGDLGYVGAIESVNIELLELLLSQNVVPVISPISIGPEYRAYNVNADHAAGKLAEAWKADDLIYITDVAGVTINGEVNSEISADEVEMLASFSFYEGETTSQEGYAKLLDEHRQRPLNRIERLLTNQPLKLQEGCAKLVETYVTVFGDKD